MNMKLIPEMIKKYFLIIACALLSISFLKAQQTPLKREVTLYNPYKPSLNEAKKINVMPDITDTAQFRPRFSYDVTAHPFMPAYTISPIKAATLQPDPLNKLYKSYVNLGFGSYISPLAELSITNERSRKGALGFYGRHYSNNGNIALSNGQRPFAGLMDNDLSLFGKKFFKGVVVGGSVDYMQRTRHAYGYHPDTLDYFPKKKDTRLGYGDIGANLSVSSTTLDSSRFAYDFNLGFDYFYDSGDFSRNRLRLKGEMAKIYKGFYAGSGLDFNVSKVPSVLQPYSKYIVALSPFVKKSTSQWQFKIGMQALLERNIEENARLHLYPDLGFGFAIVPSYINFFSSLTGRLEVNDPLEIIEENPFIIPHGQLYSVRNTDYQIVLTAGLKGNTGIGGNYELSASYSLVNDMLFYSNVLSPDTVFGRGNYFIPLRDDVDVLNIHGGMTGRITDKLSFEGNINFYKYTLTNLDFLINKPEWDASLGLKYNLRDKIIAGIQVSSLGPRRNMASLYTSLFTTEPDIDDIVTPVYIDEPWHMNLNLSAEYRYSKILSFWAKFNNLAHQRYYEWAYYPTHRFMFMLGFTYSL